jgi:hypothetical protein
LLKHRKNVIIQNHCDKYRDLGNRITSEEKRLGSIPNIGWESGNLYPESSRLKLTKTVIGLSEIIFEPEYLLATPFIQGNKVILLSFEQQNFIFSFSYHLFIKDQLNHLLGLGSTEYLLGHSNVRHLMRTIIIIKINSWISNF